MARIPVAIKGIKGVIDAAVISGQAPLLLGRPTLEKLSMSMDFKTMTLRLLQPAIETKMISNDSGQLLVNLLEFPEDKPSISAVSSKPSVAHEQVANPEARVTKVKKKVTLKQKECRCLLAQMKTLENNKQSQYAVAELFSPPRFTTEAENRGLKGLAFDIKQGWDLLDPKTQDRVDKLLDRAKPQLLVACPTCTNSGGWENLNQYFRSPVERAQLNRRNRARLRFCVKQIHKQLHRGGDFLLEHPWPSQIWKSPEINSLKRKYGVFRVDMCAFDLQCPDTSKYFQKATGLMISSKKVPETIQHKCRCPLNHEHRVIAGQLKSGERVSSFCSRYTPKFVKTMMDAFAVGSHSHTCHAVDLRDSQLECLAANAEPSADASAPVERDPPEEEASTSQDTIKKALSRLHRNLGHPSTQDLIRILRHSRASAEAIDLAGKLQCTVCANHQQPKSALPANVPQSLAFNHHIGMDVKYVKGWKVNQRVPCVNIVDYGTSYQIMVPIYNKESAEKLKEVLKEKWSSWAGIPSHLTMDPSMPNLSETLNDYCEKAGIQTH